VLRAAQCSDGTLAKERLAMFARVSTYQGETDRLIDGFRRTTQPLTQLEGFERAYFLTDSAAGRAVTVTLWESPAAMAASAEWASKARAHAAHESGAAVESVRTYEVALIAEKPVLR
jgi:heme-degrading monooxygenase HmoA